MGIKYCCVIVSGKFGLEICKIFQELNVDLLILGLLDCCFFIVKSFVDLDKLLGNFLLDYV